MTRLGTAGCREWWILKELQKECGRYVLLQRGVDVRGMKADDMRKKLKKMHDFKYKKTKVEATVSTRSHRCVFIPKYHCELNPIEMSMGPCQAIHKEILGLHFCWIRENNRLDIGQCLRAPKILILSHFNCRIMTTSNGKQVMAKPKKGTMRLERSLSFIWRSTLW